MARAEGTGRALSTPKTVVRLGLLLFLFSSAHCEVGRCPNCDASHHQDEVSRCETIVDNFIRTRKHPVRFPPGHTDNRKFIYFLHFPRTAGRSFFSCFLFKSYPPTHRCAPSYNTLRLEMSPPHCQVLASHDDYSVTDFFPPGASVFTQFRDPVDRFLSAYEFAVEIASRNFKLKKPGGVGQQEEAPKPGKKNDKDPNSPLVNTRDVWPWSYLVPYFDEDIDFSVRAAHAAHARRHELTDDPLPAWVPAMSEQGETYYWHRKTKQSKWTLTAAEMSSSLPFLDPYNNPLYIPLAEFAEDPITDELLNNGMTFQVLGITNYSYWPEAEAVRNCMLISNSAERKLMDFAKRRVDQMMHISLTKRLPESVRSLAATLGFPLDSVTYFDSKNVLQRKGAENIGVFEDRYRIMSQNFSLYQNVDLIDLGVQAYHWFMTDKIKIRMPLSLDGEEYWRLHGLVEMKRKVFRHIQKEILRRRKEMDNNSVIPHPKMKPAQESEIQPRFHRDRSPRKAKEKKSKGKKIPKPQNPRASGNFERFAVDQLWSAFHKCNGGTRTKQGTKRYKALANVAHPDARRAYFTKKARKAIPKEVLDRIREKNWLDDELFKYALKVYDKQIQEQIKRGAFAHELPEILIPSYITVKKLPKFFGRPPKPVTTCPAKT